VMLRRILRLRRRFTFMWVWAQFKSNFTRAFSRVTSMLWTARLTLRIGSSC
jgi:hypothetical protein